jgi:hypothetical protein
MKNKMCLICHYKPCLVLYVDRNKENVFFLHWKVLSASNTIIHISNGDFLDKKPIKCRNIHIERTAYHQNPTQGIKE